jgi:hypothetical protein
MDTMAFNNALANRHDLNGPCLFNLDWRLFASLATFYYFTHNNPVFLLIGKIYALWAGVVPNIILEWLREINLSHSALCEKIISLWDEQNQIQSYLAFEHIPYRGGERSKITT